MRWCLEVTEAGSHANLTLSLAFGDDGFCVSFGQPPPAPCTPTTAVSGIVLSEPKPTC